MNLKKEYLRPKQLKGHAALQFISSSGRVYLYIIPDDFDTHPSYYEFNEPSCRKLTSPKWVGDKKDVWPKKSVRNMHDTLNVLNDYQRAYKLLDEKEVKHTVFMAKL